MLEEQFNIEAFIASELSKDLLRLATAGSVDDGKSTLIGRLLHDARGAYEDQLKSVRRDSHEETDTCLLHREDVCVSSAEPGATVERATAR